MEDKITATMQVAKVKNYYVRIVDDNDDMNLFPEATFEFKRDLIEVYFDGTSASFKMDMVREISIRPNINYEKEAVTLISSVARNCPKCGAEMYDLKDGDWDCPRCGEMILSHK